MDKMKPSELIGYIILFAIIGWVIVSIFTYPSSQRKKEYEEKMEICKQLYSTAECRDYVKY